VTINYDGSQITSDGIDVDDEDELDPDWEVEFTDDGEGIIGENTLEFIGVGVEESTETDLGGYEEEVWETDSWELAEDGADTLEGSTIEIISGDEEGASADDTEEEEVEVTGKIWSDQDNNISINKTVTFEGEVEVEPIETEYTTEIEYVTSEPEVYTYNVTEYYTTEPEEEIVTEEIDGGADDGEQEETSEGGGEQEVSEGGEYEETYEAVE